MLSHASELSARPACRHSPLQTRKPICSFCPCRRPQLSIQTSKLKTGNARKLARYDSCHGHDFFGVRPAKRPLLPQKSPLNSPRLLSRSRRCFSSAPNGLCRSSSNQIVCAPNLRRAPILVWHRACFAFRLIWEKTKKHRQTPQKSRSVPAAAAILILRSPPRLLGPRRPLTSRSLHSGEHRTNKAP